MTNDICRLPSIHQLLLDLPLPQPYAPVYTQQLLPAPHLVPRGVTLPTFPLRFSGGQGSFSGSLGSFSGSASTSGSVSAATGAAAFATVAGAIPGLSALSSAVSASPSPSEATRAHDPETPALLEPPLRLLMLPVLPAVLPAPEDRDYWKPRKKRQCPECHLFFSNLATHKLTHLKPTLRPHVCKLCHRGFARPNDLFRHFKCHWKEIGADKGQFRCPFKNGTQGDHCCHLLGIFSRCDTYKNHLKAIHFQYPSGTKKNQRNTVAGLCRLCQAQFRTVDEWILTHIDAHQCPFGLAVGE